MNFVRRFHFGWLGLLLPLMLLSLNGCSTEQSATASNKDLQKYRKVYLVRPKGDDRNLTAAVLTRLKRAGFDTNETDEEGAKKMVTTKNATEPALICEFYAVSTWNYNRTYYCFENAQIHFFDANSGDLVFKADYFHPDSYLPENTELNRLFTKICDNFFPDEPNPFRDNLKGPYGPSNTRFHVEAY